MHHINKTLRFSFLISSPYLLLLQVKTKYDLVWEGLVCLFDGLSKLQALSYLGWLWHVACYEVCQIPPFLVALAFHALDIERKQAGMKSNDVWSLFVSDKHHFFLSGTFVLCWFNQSAGKTCCNTYSFLLSMLKETITYPKNDFHVTVSFMSKSISTRFSTPHSDSLIKTVLGNLAASIHSPCIYNCTNRLTHVSSADVRSMPHT